MNIQSGNILPFNVQIVKSNYFEIQFVSNDIRILYNKNLRKYNYT